MSIFVFTLGVLVAAVVFVAPFILELMRENKYLRELCEEFEYLRMASEDTSDGILVQDMAGRIIWSNQAYCDIHGVKAEDIKGRNPLEFVLPPDKTPTAQEIKEFRFDPEDPVVQRLQIYQNVRSDGTLFWNQLNVSFHTAEDGRENAILVCRDVTEQVEHQNQMRSISKQLKYEATHDGLTGIANRAAFLSFVERALSEPECGPVGLLHIDLDDFKSLNDTHGHSAGDAALTNTADIIQATITDDDLVARIGGDEFVVVCPHTPDLAYLEDISARLVRAICDPFEWSNCMLQIHASIGASLSTAQHITAQDLLTRADFALYAAKDAGRNTVALYDEDMHERHVKQGRRAAEIVDAIDTGNLQYYFQPIVNIENNAITRMETLVRWVHPTEGLIAPDEFLPLVKELGMIGTMDLLSMTAALEQKRALNLAGHDHIGIAFNASPELLSHPDFIRRLVWGVEAAGIDRAQITIEVLETTNFGDAAQASSHAATIRDLRHAGFQVHLDDFGIGFAGLSHLATLDVTGVKIDRGLVTDLLTDQTSRKIVRKIVELANDLGLSVTAEGVEDAQTADALHTMGCHIIQGYWLSRPLPEADIQTWLAAHNHQPDEKRA